jgi:hypothetical protein
LVIVYKVAWSKIHKRTSTLEKEHNTWRTVTKKDIILQDQNMDKITSNCSIDQTNDNMERQFSKSRHKYRTMHEVYVSEKVDNWQQEKEYQRITQ